MSAISVFNGLHLRYDGPIPEWQRRVAIHGSTQAFRRRRAHAMAERYSSEYGRVLVELWRHESAATYGANYPTDDRLRDLGFYRRQRVEWDRHERALSAAAPGAGVSR